MGARVVYAFVATFGVLLALELLGLWYINDANVKRSQEICGIIVLLDDRNQQVTPTSESQRQFIEAIHNYRIALDC